MTIEEIEGLVNAPVLAGIEAAALVERILAHLEQQAPALWASHLET